jgi:hypothetical protein
MSVSSRKACVRWRTLLIHASLLANFIAGAGAAAQNKVELRGRIVDQITKTPLVGAVVRLPELRRFTLTNQYGLFQFSNIPTGNHSVTVAQLGYMAGDFKIDLGEQRNVVLELAPDPFELQAIVIKSGTLNYTAGERANRLRTFWNAWDRDKIVQSGIDEPIEFLRKVARVQIKRCVGQYVDNEGILKPYSKDHLCVSAVGQAPSRFVGGTGSHINSMRRSATERLRGQPPRSYTIPPTYSSARRTPLYLNDRMLPESVNELTALRMANIERVEIFGYRGEREIRLYTQSYMNLLATGAPRPSLALTLDEAFQRTPWEQGDSLRGRRR